jgi:Immunity protein 52
MKIEIKKSGIQKYYIRAAWEARLETPEAIAARCLRTFDSLAEIDPLFKQWTCGRTGPVDLETVRDRYAEEVKEGVSRDGRREPEPESGYWCGGHTRDLPPSRTFRLNFCAGASIKAIFPNHVMFETSTFRGARPDPDVVTHRIFRSAMLAIVDAWQPVKAGAYSQALIELRSSGTYFPKPWIQYLCPWLARQIAPPPSALVERLPDGGLLMSAATETFDVDNPKHMAVAGDIAAAMAPLDLLPWPSHS